MKITNKRYVSLLLWIVGLVGMGYLIGSFTKIEVGTWYKTLDRSPLTPPDITFGIVWTVLYSMIAICGWMIWRKQSNAQVLVIKRLFIVQLLLNWSWTPLFFYYHLVTAAFFVIIAMDILVGMIIHRAYSNLRMVSLLMTPYLLWLLFATYLNFHIMLYN